MPDKNRGGAGGEEGAGPSAPALPALPPAGGLSYVVCGEPLLKAEYLDGLVGLHCSAQAGEGFPGARECGPVVYMDFDLMYGGFARAGMASRQPGGMLHVRPAGREEAGRALARAVSVVSAGVATVIVDTLNGLYDAVGDTGEYVRQADAAIMMLAMAAGSTRSRVVVACVARPHRDGAWALMPGRRRLAAAAACTGGQGRAASLLHLVRGSAGPMIRPACARAAAAAGNAVDDSAVDAAARMRPTAL